RLGTCGCFFSRGNGAGAAKAVPRTRMDASSAVRYTFAPPRGKLVHQPDLCLAACAVFWLALEAGPQVIAVHLRDELRADLLRTGRLTFIIVGAVAEALGIHLRDHLQHALAAFGLSLWQRAQV